MLIAGNQSTTADLCMALMAHHHVEGIVNVGPRHADQVADYVDLEPFCKEHGLRLIRPRRYDLKDCQADFEGVRLDLLIVVGWQRLIPAWLLDRLTIGAFGMHGSSEPLPKGRGRSPMNWSLIEGKTRFLTHLFRYDAGVDSGDVVAVQEFDIHPWDDIRSLHHKNALAQERLLLDHLPAILSGAHPVVPQEGTPTYYPKRTPADGVLDWNEPADFLHRLIRAVAPPYPGAFTFQDGERIDIEEAVPFDSRLTFEAPPGTVVAAFHDGTFVVQTGSVGLYVRRHRGATPKKGDVLESRHNESRAKLEAM